MNTKMDMDALKKEIQDANEEINSGVGLSLMQKVAANIIRCERSYFYGDKNDNGRLRELRNIISDGFEQLEKEESE